MKPSARLAQTFERRLADLKLTSTILVDRPCIGVLQVSVNADKLVSRLTKVLGAPDGEVFNNHRKDSIAMVSWHRENADGNLGQIRVYPSGPKSADFVVARTGFAKYDRADAKLREKVEYTLPVRAKATSGTKFQYEPKMLTMDWQFMSVPITVDGEVHARLMSPIKTKVSPVLVLVGSGNPRHEVHVPFPSVKAALNFVVTAF